MCYDTTKLDKLVDDYTKTAGKAEDLVDDAVGKKQRGEPLVAKTVRVIGAKSDAWTKEKYGLKPVKVDALEYYGYVRACVCVCGLHSVYVYVCHRHSL
jgi:hypothetical protein